ncbi:CBL-interacting serine/threonine-protein kinase 21-like isoform X1 [Tripterygium wilfordii]|uniref:CBL-interacting serine/threonine-protein kinase 21-like isoform X1 n=1 Tax=Tripterygium wilfordii TaxID=458696 RepID=UPI0018F82045|nr:CBL-interacting serine/threonine-protein kinase 21-like isoform X1 [Tripterygium wilfordii]XP_038699220.1 CBL-interacting serine/threonine-protein kinase 21-like isoform X1 [Tripterygium wilfordii]
MGFENNIGKYRLGQTIGEGTFAKVKLAVDTTNGSKVAVKIIDKQMVVESNLKYQVKREIRNMKLLHHPNIVRIYEVIGTKTKIYLVMEYVPGGQLSDKLSYIKKLGESEARKIFHQLIDAVDYCHSRGVYHRDLKPENVLLDSKGNIKVSDFGLSTLRKPGDILTTTCGSPCYVAPELLANKGYDGAAADVWSCGVILYELLACYLPFDDNNLMILYKKISGAEYAFPQWFTESEKRLISRILCPNPKKRVTIPEIIDDKWFQKDYVPSCGYECTEKVQLDDVNAALDSIEENGKETNMTKSSYFINAFQLIAMSQVLDLSGLFEEQDKKQLTRLGSKHTVNETIKKIEAAAMDVSLAVERMNNFKANRLSASYQMKMLPKQRMTRCSRSYFDLSAKVIEVSPNNCVVEISKSAGELRVYKEFCSSLSSLLKDI